MGIMIIELAINRSKGYDSLSYRFGRPCILGWVWRRGRKRSCPCRSRPRSAALFARRTWSAAWWWSWWGLMMTSVYRMDDVRMTITSQLVGQRWRFRFQSHKWRCLRQSCKILLIGAQFFFMILTRKLYVCIDVQLPVTKGLFLSKYWVMQSSLGK